MYVLEEVVLLGTMYGLKIGSKSFISIGSVIIKNLPPSSDVIGNPAEPKELYVKKSYALLKICKGK